MKKIATILSLAALVAAAPASASVRLTVKEAQKASRLSAEQTLGSLLYRSVGAAPVEVTNCSVSGRRGRCHVIVTGTSRCEYTSHVLELSNDYTAWATGLRCGS